MKIKLIYLLIIFLYSCEKIEERNQEEKLPSVNWKLDYGSLTLSEKYEIIFINDELLLMESGSKKIVLEGIKNYKILEGEILCMTDEITEWQSIVLKERVKGKFFLFDFDGNSIKAFSNELELNEVKNSDSVKWLNAKKIFRSQ